MLTDSGLGLRGTLTFLLCILSRQSPVHLHDFDYHFHPDDSPVCSYPSSLGPHIYLPTSYIHSVFHKCLNSASTNKSMICLHLKTWSSSNIPYLRKWYHQSHEQNQGIISDPFCTSSRPTDKSSPNPTHATSYVSLMVTDIIPLTLTPH